MDTDKNRTDTNCTNWHELDQGEGFVEIRVVTIPFLICVNPCRFSDCAGKAKRRRQLKTAPGLKSRCFSRSRFYLTLRG